MESGLLQDSLTKEYMIDKYEIQLLVSTRELVKRSNNQWLNNKKINKVSLFAPVEFGKYKSLNFQNLYGTLKEIKNISKILDEQNINYDFFTHQKATLQNLNNIQESDIIHIATHSAYFENNEEYSKILNPLLRDVLFLNTEISQKSVALTAYEIINLSLQNTELVVLSSESEGEMKNSEGLYGLNRAFLLAGAKSVISAQMNVNDKSAIEFMRIFYEKLFTIKNKNKAMREAMLQIREKYLFPYFWGAFILIGE